MRRFTLAIALVLLPACTTGDKRGTYSGDALSSESGFIAGTVIGERVDTPPLLLSGRTPIFSAKLPVKGIYSGNAVIRYRVTVDGRAVSPQVVSATDMQVAAGVIYVMPSWKMKPATRDGVAVEVTVEKDFIFKEARGGSNK